MLARIMSGVGRTKRVSPATMVVLTIALAVATASASLFLALTTPWLGLTLSVGAEAVTVDRAAGPSASIPVPARLVSIGGITVEELDLLEDPDTITELATFERFLERQDRLHRSVGSGPVSVTYLTPDGVSRSLVVTPASSRPLGTLPMPFWFQLAVGVGCFFIGVWVLAFRPELFATRAFFASGAALLLSVAAAAVYSTRELALPARTFRWLSTLNHLGAILFGVALVSLFLDYPTPLVRGVRRLLPAMLLLPAWFVGEVLRVVPHPTVTMYGTVLLLTLAILGLVLAQRWIGRKEALARAALRWVGLSASVTASAWVVTVAVPVLMGSPPLLSQSWSFGFFLILYSGLALGVRRYRLFDIQLWSVRIFAWILMAAIFGLIDVALVIWIGIDHRTSTTSALVMCAFGYLPLRSWLWSRARGQKPRDEQEFFGAILEIAFTKDDANRASRWRALLRDAFQPLEILPAEGDVGDVAMTREGLGLVVPPAAGEQALEILYPFGGRGFFTPRHVALARSMAALARHAEESRQAYEKGVSEERKRIARDLHDDLGARLLSGLYRDDLDGTRETIRHALREMRAVVTTLAGQSIPLETLLADVRREVADRLGEASIELSWPIPHDPAGTLLDARVARHYVSMVREGVSNVIRHARARRVEVSVRFEPDGFTTLLSDDGRAVTAGSDAFGGNGLQNLHARATEAGGKASLQRKGDATVLEIRIPIPPPGSRVADASSALSSGAGA